MKIRMKRKTYNAIKEWLGWLLFGALGALPFLMIINEMGK